MEGGGGVTEFGEATGEAVADLFRAIAIRAQVSEDDAQEIGVGDLAQQCLDLDVG